MEQLSFTFEFAEPTPNTAARTAMQRAIERLYPSRMIAHGMIEVVLDLSAPLTLHLGTQPT